MNQQVDKRNYDVASIGQPGKKRANYVQDALHIDRSKIARTSQFIKVFSDMFLKRETSHKAYF
ncbi:hypothetical protein ACFL37_00450 [Candidatus Margulisiibacteriota bacterium]